MARNILITGASQGLGLALARALAHEGQHLILTARGERALMAVRDELAVLTPVTALAGDVTDPAHRRSLAEAAKAQGGLDAVVNNAGTLGPSPLPPMLLFSVRELRELFEVNAIAPLALVQALADTLKPGARILNVTSDAAVESYAGWGGYGASKLAMERLSRVLSVENPQWRIYEVDPGDMRTRMHQSAFPGEDISDRPLPEARVPAFLRLLTEDWPSGRYQAIALDEEVPHAAGHAGV